MTDTAAPLEMLKSQRGWLLVRSRTIFGADPAASA